MNSFRFVGILIFLLCPLAFAADGSGPGGKYAFRQKAERKESSRWTLQEWLQQKERNRLMDLWLSIHSPSPYEFYLKGAYNSYQTSTVPASTETDRQSYSGGLGAYATIIGIQADYENNTQEKFNDLSGSLNLRLLGNAVQGTHLIVHYGLRTRTFDTGSGVSRIGNQFAGADLNLYLTRYFGLRGLYDSYFAKEDEAIGTVSGTRTEAGLFIDFESLRIFGNWFNDTQKTILNNNETSTERKGIQTGIQFFF